MKIIANGSTLDITLDSAENAIITVSNDGLSSVNPVLHLNTEDLNGVDIPHTTAFTYENIVTSQGAAAIAGSVLQWPVGPLSPGSQATINYELEIVDVTLFPDKFRVHAVSITPDDNPDNDMTFRNFDVLKCDDVLACGAAGNGLFDVANEGTTVDVQNAVLTNKLNFTGNQMQFGSYGVGTYAAAATFNLGVDATGNIVEVAGGGADGNGIFTAGNSGGGAVVPSLYSAHLTDVIAFHAPGGTTSAILLTNTTTGEIPTLAPTVSAEGNDLRLIRPVGALFQVAITSGQEQLEVLPTGQLRLNNYGSSSFTGTAAANLQVDASGNIIETITVFSALQTSTYYDSDVLAGVGGVLIGDFYLTSAAHVDGLPQGALKQRLV